MKQRSAPRGINVREGGFKREIQFEEQSYYHKEKMLLDHHFKFSSDIIKHLQEYIRAINYLNSIQEDTIEYIKTKEWLQESNVIISKNINCLEESNTQLKSLEIDPTTNDQIKLLHQNIIRLLKTINGSEYPIA